MEAPQSAKCTCGHTKGQHYQDHPIDWPCKVAMCTCDNFEEADEED